MRLCGAYLIGIQPLKQIDSGVVKVDELLPLLVVGVAARLEGADARAVRLPLVLPELLVAGAFVLPVRVHVA